MIFEYIHFGVSVLVLMLVGLIAFFLKGVIRTLKDAFESMKISVEYVKEVQKVSKSLYDPHEIEKLVKLRVEAATSEIRAEAECMSSDLFGQKWLKQVCTLALV